MQAVLKRRSDNQSGDTPITKARITNLLWHIYQITRSPRRKLTPEDKKIILHDYVTCKFDSKTANWTETGIQEFVAKLNSCSVSILKKILEDEKYEDKRVSNNMVTIIPENY